MALPDSLEGLLLETSYPHPCPHIELIETHISWVILTGEFAYKLKKPVRFSFVDFSTLELREHFCQEEVRCNRTFAPELYLDVVAVEAGPEGSLQVAADGASIERTAPLATPIEWAVKMRQFDPAMGADRLLARGALDGDALRQFGRSLAQRHAALPRHAGTTDEVPVRVFGPVEDNFSEIGNTGLMQQYGELVTSAHASARALGDALRPWLDTRMERGCIRECHGDLHLANLALINGRITAFDCLEFNANLRWIDTMSDVAFLFMDCRFRGEGGLAYGFLDGYLDHSGDYDGVRLLGYFAAYRSVVRAKVAALRWAQDADAETEDRFVAHVRWALDWLRRPPGRLILTCGLSGSGKSYLAGRLIERLPAIRLRSDIVRKRLHGLDARAASDSPVDGGLYGADQSDSVHDYLAELAGSLLTAGETVIVDATFIERERRRQFRELAESIGAATHILHCQAPEQVLRERLAARTQAGDDPSEATVEVLELQLGRFQPPTEEEGSIDIDMAQPLTDQRMDSIMRRIEEASLPR